MMTKLMMTAALALVLGAGAASAATLVAEDGAAAPRMQFAQVSPQSRFVQTRIATPSRYSAFGSSAFPVGSYAGDANSGNPSVPGAPTATAVNGGGGQ
jgi:hypothetical protein